MFDMKKIMIVAALVVAFTSLSAQPPQGGGGRGEGQGPRGGGRPMMNRDRGAESGNMEGIGITKLPEIPELTDKQREKLIDNLTKEHKDIAKLMSEKHELKIKMDNMSGMDEKEKDKSLSKMRKVDEKIEKSKDKYEKKYRSVLNEEQYLVFQEKKKDVEFRKPQQFRKRMQNSESGEGKGERLRDFEDGGGMPDMKMPGGTGGF